MVNVITYNKAYRDDFVRLNREWIETYFRLEKSDLHTFAHIDDYIIGRGGQVFLAQDDETDEIVGCCALISHPETQSHELAKMAVSPQHQGRHIGKQLGQTLIDYARKHGVRHIFLEGNTRLKVSIALYRQLGFREIPLEGVAYERCDILMELNL
ncbi:MAG: GNAT family N-acetyltransferase [Bacteroidaceae bacterium]|nr:GNAT family N-acetyltransferase [Bacteroidaceae bacterium]